MHHSIVVMTTPSIVQQAFIVRHTHIVKTSMYLYDITVQKKNYSASVHWLSSSVFSPDVQHKNRSNEEQ